MINDVFTNKIDVEIKQLDDDGNGPTRSFDIPSNGKTLINIDQLRPNTP